MPDGAAAPWPVVLDALCEHYGVPPWEIDMEHPGIRDAVGRTLALWKIEAQISKATGKT